MLQISNLSLPVDAEGTQEVLRQKAAKLLGVHPDDI